MVQSARLDRDALRRILEQQLYVITRQQALAVGLTRHGLRHRLRPEGPWRGVLPGVYIAATGTATFTQEEMAALLYAGQPSVITGPAALLFHHIGGAPSEFIDVLVPATRERGNAAFVRLHRTIRMPVQTGRLGPLRFAPPARAVADAVRGMSGNYLRRRHRSVDVPQFG